MVLHKHPVIVYVNDYLDLFFQEAKDLVNLHKLLDEYMNIIDFRFLIKDQHDIHHEIDIYPKKHLIHLLYVYFFKNIIYLYVIVYFK